MLAICIFRLPALAVTSLLKPRPLGLPVGRNIIASFILERDSHDMLFSRPLSVKCFQQAFRRSAQLRREWTQCCVHRSTFTAFAALSPLLCTVFCRPAGHHSGSGQTGCNAGLVRHPLLRPYSATLSPLLGTPLRRSVECYSGSEQPGCNANLVRHHTPWAMLSRATAGSLLGPSTNHMPRRTC